MLPNQNFMPKRSAALQKTIDTLNGILALEDIMLYDKDGKLFTAKSDTELAKTYKDGICSALEALLNHYDTYKGFRFLDTANREKKSFDREYF